MPEVSFQADSRAHSLKTSLRTSSLKAAPTGASGFAAANFERSQMTGDVAGIECRAGERAYGVGTALPAFPSRPKAAS